MEPKIKTCPLCGGEPKIRHHVTDTYDVKCTVCGCRSGLYDSEPDAVDAWNTRVPNLDTNEKGE